MKIPIKDIHVPPGRRGLTYAKIAELSNSISTVGLLHPITVDEKYTLIAGQHRLEAAKRLGWTEIECIVAGLSGLQAQLAEIDENVVRVALSRQQLGELLSQRKKIYEALNPAAIARNRPGHVSNHQSSTDNLSAEPPVKSFVEDTAEKLGMSPRTVARMVWVAEHTTPEATAMLRKTERGSKITQDEAVKLARLDADQQKEAAALYAAGEIASFDDYPPKVRLAEPEVNEADTNDAEIFLSDFTEFSRNFRSAIADFGPSFETVFAALTAAQLDKVLRMADELHSAISDLMEQVRGDRHG